MQIDISNKVVVITGASRGIGRELTKKLSSENSIVIINYNNSYDAALSLYNEIINSNNKCMMIKADVAKYDEVQDMCKKVIEKFGRIDVLINNAGICSDNYIPIMKNSKWENVINTNLIGLFYCTKVFSKEMIKNKRGKIINIASIKGQLGSEGQCNYSVSKAGVIAFTKSIAKELGVFNISVNAICPGYIRTELNMNNENKKRIASQMSVMRVENNLDELINFIIFMISDKFNYVSGRVFNIDSRIK